MVQVSIDKFFDAHVNMFNQHCKLIALPTMKINKLVYTSHVKAFPRAPSAPSAALAYASCALNQSEQKYGITEMETLGVTLGCKTLQGIPVWSQTYSLH